MDKFKHRIILFLRWSERFTKTDMVYLVQGGFWLAMAQISASIAGVVLTVVLAKILAPETLGEYRFLLAGFSLLGIVALPGMNAALRESTPKGNLGNLSLAFKKMMSYGSVGSLISIVVASYYFWQGDSQLGLGFIIIALALPLFDSSAVYLEYLNALKKFSRAALYTTITRLTLLVSTLTVALLYPEFAWLILTMFLFGQIIPGLLLHKKTEKEFVVAGTKSDSTLVNYAKHLTIMAALGLIAGQIDKFFVWEFIGASGLATLYIANVIPQEAGRFLSLVTTLAFPKFATADPKVIKRTLPLKLFKYFCVIAVGIIAYILLAPYIFVLLFSKYQAAIIYSQVLILGALAAAFSPIKTFLTTQKKTRYLYILSVVSPAVRITTALLLIIPFGIWGAVYALLMEALIRSILLSIMFYFVKV